jgi:hypothetical protein
MAQSVLFSQGKIVDGLALSQQAVDVLVSTLGREHPDVGGCYNNMAVMAAQLGEYHRAIKLFDEAAAIYNKCYGENNVYTRQCAQDAAVVRLRLSCEAAAENDKKL